MLVPMGSIAEAASQVATTSLTPQVLANELLSGWVLSLVPLVSLEPLRRARALRRRVLGVEEEGAGR